jgi:osmotically-inducible protein OsmY
MRSDPQLRNDVREALAGELGVTAAPVGVTARKGVVALTGRVTLLAEKFAAEQAAKRVRGVKAVANDIEVRLPDGHPPTDLEMAGAALHALQRDTTVPKGRVRVTVRGGWITLEGTVHRQSQKEAAGHAVRNLLGLQGMTNAIHVRPKVAAREVKRQIEAAFRRSARLEARRVRVETQGGKVVLRGKLPSWAERDEAERAAWAAEGVSQVDNYITITPYDY